MGNKSKAKPTSASPPRTPRGRDLPRFATVRDPAINGFVVVNLDHVVGAVFTVNRGGYPRFEISGDNMSEPLANHGQFHGVIACELAAHLVLCGVDVEGAADALDRARPGFYDVLKEARAKAAAADEEHAATRAALPAACCEKCKNSDISDRAITYCMIESMIGSDGKCFDFDDTPDPDDEQAIRDMTDDSGPPISIGELAADLHRAGVEIDPAERRRRLLWAAGEAERVASEEGKTLAEADELRDVAAHLRADAAELLAAATTIDADRGACFYGEACRRFPRCKDCSLYALADRTTPADPAHVEEVTGQTRDELARLVGCCTVFLGMQSSGAEIGRQWCGVGHEMKEPKCALCPYLRISPPAL